MRRNDYLARLKDDLARWEAQVAIWEDCAARAPARLATAYARQLDLVENILRCARGNLLQMQSAPEGAWHHMSAPAAYSRRELRAAFERVRRRMEDFENLRRAA